MSTQEGTIITPEAQGTWIASAFILALIGFLLAMFSIYRGNTITAATQLEILSLNKKIETLQKQGPASGSADQGSTEKK